MSVNCASRFHTVWDRCCGFLLAALATASLLSCASQSPKERLILAGGSMEIVLVLPLNTTAIISPELEILTPLVWSEIEIYLGADGVRLKTAPRRDLRSLWLSSIRKARENDARSGFDDAARLLVRALVSHTDFDAVIIPSLFIREASISGDTATWDGVERSLEFHRSGHAVPGNSVDTSFVGVAPAASLHAVVLDADGNKLHDAIGGLELLVRVRVKETLGSDGQNLVFAPRKGLFAKPENLREGIALALSPIFLPPL